MNTLPDDIQDKIYLMAHQIMFTDVVNELLQTKIYCHYGVTLSFVNNATYVYNGHRYKCVNINNLDVTPYELLNVLNAELKLN